MYSDLMGAAGFDVEFNKRGPFEALFQFPMCESVSGFSAVDRHFFAIHGVSPNGKIDTTAGSLYLAEDQCQIGLFYTSILELFAKPVQRGQRFRHDESTRCVLVQAVNDSRS